MASAHSLRGLMKWITRHEWRDRFAEVYDAHLQPACERSGVDVDEVVSILGEDFFMTTVWGSAFEDFLTRDFDGGHNIVEDYLKRRGWKESASTRAYMTALRTSVASLYEVSDIIKHTSFRAGAIHCRWHQQKILDLLTTVYCHIIAKMNDTWL